MELKEFIKNTLTAIEEWVNEVNSWKSKEKSNEYSLTKHNNHNQGWVEFDLVVISEEKEWQEWWGKINILGNSMWWTLTKESTNTNHSRIKFTISVSANYSFLKSNQP